jgi:rare lipoprotein A (peptidoglycan hydrolase)
MKSLTKAFILLFMILLAGFTLVNIDTKKESVPVVNNSTNAAINEEDNMGNTSVVSYIDKGKMKISWYGPRFHGKLTANGEVFDQSSFTAAHKKYRFGTLLKITNPDNNQSVVVRINDRGPFVSGREIDVSRAAANELGLLGTGVAKMNVDEVVLKGANFPVIMLN